MSSQLPEKSLRVLLVDDDPDDLRLMVEALQESKLDTHIDTARDGVEALAFLRKEGKYANAVHPDLILLDLNMPKRDGHQVLVDIKFDPTLQHIPVVILTTSEVDEEVLRTYDLGANCYVTKPADLEQFAAVVRSIEHFWFTVVKRLKNDELL